MRQLIVTEFITLDGVVDSPGGGDHPEAGWTFRGIETDTAMFDLKAREEQEAGALLLGRQSYAEFAPIWPTMEEFATYNAMPKYVVSTTLTEVDPGWLPTEILRSTDDVAALKETEGGPLLLTASPTLAQSLAAAGLVDRYHLLTFPVVLGHGKRLFATDAERADRLRLVEHATYPNGVQMQVLDVVR
ncbi:MAG: deaminase [Nocardioides sp.]|nr:deaminase [Nocardioides sp.]